MAQFEFEISYPADEHFRDQRYKWDINDRRVATVISNGEFYTTALQNACIGLEKALGRDTHNPNSGIRAESYSRLSEAEASLGQLAVDDGQVLEYGSKAIYDENTLKYEGKRDLEEIPLQEAA
jgi:hypothetical protein